MAFFTFNEPQQVTFDSLPNVLIYGGAESFPAVRAAARIIEPLMDDRCKALFYTVKPHCKWGERILTIRQFYMPQIPRCEGENHHPSTLNIEVPQLILLHDDFKHKERIDSKFCSQIYQNLSLYANIGMLDLWFDWFDVEETNYLDITRHLYYFDLDIYLTHFKQPKSPILRLEALAKYARPLVTNEWNPETYKGTLPNVFKASRVGFWKRLLATGRKTNDE